MPLDGDLLLVQRRPLGVADLRSWPVIEILRGAVEDAEERVVAALQRTEGGQRAEVPLADQRGALADLLQQ